MDYIKTSGPSEGAHKCRCCLQKGDHPHNVHKELYTKLLRDTLNLVLTSDSRLPQSICSTCVRFLQQAKKFRNMVIASERQLLQEFILNNWQTEPQDENDLITDNFQKEIEFSVANSAEISKAQAQKDPLSDGLSIKIENNDQNIRISEVKSLRSQDDETSDSLCKVESSVADNTGSYDDDDDTSQCSDGQRSGDDSDYEEVPEIKKRRGEAKNWVLVNKFTDVNAAEEAIKQENTWSTSTTHKTQDGTKRLYRCNKMRKRGPQCSANICLAYDNPSEAFYLYRSDRPHDHDQKIDLAYAQRLTTAVKTEISRLQDLDMRPRTIMLSLMKMQGIKVPTMLQLRNYMMYRKRKLLGLTNLPPKSRRKK